MSRAIEITGENFSSVEKGVTLLDFWATWCGPCKTQGPIVEKIAEKMAGKVNVGKVNVDEAAVLAGRFAIKSIPTLLILKDGHELERMIGVQSEAEIEGKLKRYAK